MKAMGEKRIIDRILISTMPRSGTVFFFEFISKLFGFSKLDPSFAEGSWPKPPEWDPYKFDRTYMDLKSKQVLCAHYPLNDDINRLLEDESLLGIYLYRDPRDVVVSAAMYIKYALLQHPLHSLFSEISDSEAITFLLAGGLVPLPNQDQCDFTSSFIKHEGIKYFCDWGASWVHHPRVAKIRYEDFILNNVEAINRALSVVGVIPDKEKINEISQQMSFEKLTGRQRGEENKASHFRKGVVGDYKNNFGPLQYSICNQRIGGWLKEMGYEESFNWGSK